MDKTFAQRVAVAARGLKYPCRVAAEGELPSYVFAQFSGGEIVVNDELTHCSDADLADCIAYWAGFGDALQIARQPA